MDKRRIIHIITKCCFYACWIYFGFVGRLDGSVTAPDGKTYVNWIYLFWILHPIRITLCMLVLYEFIKKKSFQKQWLVTSSAIWIISILFTSLAYLRHGWFYINGTWDTIVSILWNGVLTGLISQILNALQLFILNYFCNKRLIFPLSKAQLASVETTVTAAVWVLAFFVELEFLILKMIERKSFDSVCWAMMMAAALLFIVLRRKSVKNQLILTSVILLPWTAAVLWLYLKTEYWFEPVLSRYHGPAPAVLFVLAVLITGLAASCVQIAVFSLPGYIVQQKMEEQTESGQG